MQNAIINNYQIQSELGRGGMATVYLAHDNKFDTQVAIKVLNKEFVHNDNIRKRFLAEARNMFKMSHPNIVKVTDLIDDGDLVAFVMEYVEGETLKEYLDKKGKLGDEEIRAIFTQMLEGVGYVHEQNLVHRDIKPSNFMIDGKGRVKLMDFGIAKNTDASAAEYTQTGTGMQMGTPMYMSPEQITETKSVTAQSDIYSLGVVLWQMAAGRKPYDVKTLSSFQLQTRIVNVPLSHTKTMWDSIVGKATAKDPMQRYVHCKLFQGDLNESSVSDIISNDRTIIEGKSKKNEEFTVIEKNTETALLLPGSVFDSNGALKHGFVDINGSWVIQPLFDNVHSFDEQGMALTMINNKYGYINRQGNWVIQPMFDDLCDFDDEGIAQAQLNEKWGFINQQGNWVIQPIFDSLGGFDDQGMAEAEINEKYGFINRQGNWVIQPMFDYLGFCGFDDQGMAWAWINKKWGFINRQGNWVIQPVFDIVENFDHAGMAKVKLNGKWGYMNRRGDWVIQPTFDSVRDFDDQGMARAEVNEQYGFVNRQGTWVIQPTFDSVSDFDDQGMARAKVNERYGFINRQGTWVIQPTFDSVSDFDNQEMAKARINEKWGFINRQGNWVIQPTFDSVSDFDDQGMAKVELNGKWGYMNRRGDWVIQPIFDTFVKEENSNDDDDDDLILDYDFFNVGDYFSDISDVYIDDAIDRSKVFNLLKNAGMKQNDIEPYMQDELWVSHDSTFWGSGKEGFIISSNGEYLWFAFCEDGIKWWNRFTWFEDYEDEESNCFVSFKNKNGDLIIEYFNADEEEEKEISISFNSNVTQALVSFYDNEIAPRQTR